MPVSLQCTAKTHFGFLITVIALVFLSVILFQSPKSSTAAESPKELSADCTVDDSMTTMGNEVPTDYTQHVVVLVHGIMGNHKELFYVKEALGRKFSSHNPSEKLIVHAAAANDDNTLDGIHAGGMRLADEINDLLQKIATKAASDTTVQFSILGNSLGGLYARYALAHIDWDMAKNIAPESTSEGTNGDTTKSTSSTSSRVQIVPNLFVTTATPHLGVRDMTYWRVPKSFQPAGAWSMKQSGQDLFRYSDLLHELCMSPKFLKPLASFSQRRAYANAFATDAAVPTSTAAFLSEKSTTPHTLVGDRESTTLLGVGSTILHTNGIYPTIRFQTHSSFCSDNAQTEADRDSNNEPDSVASYTQALDSLGWTKIFIDVRSHIPALWRRGKQRQELHRMAQEKVSIYTSSELKQRLSAFDWNTLPFGHSFLIASTKNSIYSWFYSGGRPLVDQIAEELVKEMIRDEQQ